MKITCLFYFVSQVLKLLLLKSYIIQLGFRWVLRRERVRSQGKELKDCLSGKKPLGLQFIFYEQNVGQVFLTNLHFFALFIAGTKHSISKFSRLQAPHFRLPFDNADLNANYQNLRMAIFDTTYLSSFSINLSNPKILFYH